MLNRIESLKRMLEEELFMSLAIQKSLPVNEGVSKEQFEREHLRLLNKINQLDYHVSKKADEVVLSMVLNHREELENIEEKITSLEDRFDSIKQVSEVESSHSIEKNKPNPFKRLLKHMKFIR